MAAVRRAEVVTADETGWRVGGDSAWLWAFVGQRILDDGTVVRFVVYLVAKGRGFPEASAVLGAGFDQVIERDGWAPYRKFVKATHQMCTAHLLRRCVGMIEDAGGADAEVPEALKRILKDSLALRAARDAGEVDAGAVATGLADLRRRVDDLLATVVTHPGNVRLLKHLGKSRAPVHLLGAQRRRGHQLEGRAGHPPRCREPQVLGRQLHLGGRGHPGGALLGACHRTGSGQGPHLGAGSLAEESHPEAGRPYPARRRGRGVAVGPGTGATGSPRPWPVAQAAVSPPRITPQAHPSDPCRRLHPHRHHAKKVLDVDGDAYHAAIGHFEGDELVAHHSSGGDPEILEMLAEVVADNPKG